jgi:hypothetical protein
LSDTQKVGVLGGFSSAVVLAVTAILIAWESVGRSAKSLIISFEEAADGRDKRVNAKVRQAELSSSA